MNQNGLASADIEVVDQSFLIQGGLLGVIAVLGVTERGTPNDPRNGLVGSWIEYTRKFGGLLANSLFPLLCKRALDAGAQLRVSRVEHYTDLTDKTTATGVKASVTASSIVPVLTSVVGSTTGGTIAAGTKNYVMVGVFSSGELTAPSNELSVTNTGTTSSNTLTGVAIPNAISYRFYFGPTGAEDHYLESTTPTLVDAGAAGTAGALPTANTAVLTASNAGAWANGGALTVAIVPAVSRIAGKIDIHVSLAGYDDMTQDIYDVTQNIQVTEKTKLNLALNFIQIGTVTGMIPTGVFSNFVNGAVTSPVAADYVGDPTQSLGLNSFDGSTDFVKLACWEMADPTIDAAIDAYQRMRGDFIGILRTPIGLNGDGVVAYRNRTDAYAGQGTVIDNAYMFMFTGGLKVSDPLSGNILEIPETGDIGGLMSTKDNKSYPWMSFSGAKRGVIKNAIDVVYNFGSEARSTEAANVDQNGVNVVVNNEFGITSWGNGTLQKSNTLLKKAEVAELVIYLKRALKPAVRIELFDPNDVDSWKAIYKNVKKIMDPIKTNRGIWKYIYQGDQDIMDVRDAKINTPDNIDAGKYTFFLYVAPKVGMKYIQIKVVVTNSSVDYTVATGALPVAA